MFPEKSGEKVKYIFRRFKFLLMNVVGINIFDGYYCGTPLAFEKIICKI